MVLDQGQFGRYVKSKHLLFLSSKVLWQLVNL